MAARSEWRHDLEALDLEAARQLRAPGVVLRAVRAEFSVRYTSLQHGRSGLHSCFRVRANLFRQICSAIGRGQLGWGQLVPGQLSRGNLQTNVGHIVRLC